MNEPLLLLISLAGGGIIGFVFFGGLWITTRKVLNSSHPALLSLTSFFGRSLIALGGFYLIARQGDWKAVVAAAVGFLAARFAATALIRRAHER